MNTTTNGTGTSGVWQLFKERAARDRLYGAASYWDARAGARHGMARSLWPSNAFNALWDERQQELIARALDPVLGRRIVDVGCGTGRIARWLAEDRRADEVVGVDFSSATVEAARFESSALVSSGVVRYEQGDIVAGLDALALGEFDDAIVLGCLSVACRDRPSLERAIGNVARLVRPKGRVLLLEPIHRSPLRASRSSARTAWASFPRGSYSACASCRGRSSRRSFTRESGCSIGRLGSRHWRITSCCSLRERTEGAAMTVRLVQLGALLFDFQRSWILGLGIASVACSSPNNGTGTALSGSSTAAGGSTSTGANTGQAGSQGATGSGSSAGGSGGGGTGASGVAGSASAGTGGNATTGSGGSAITGAAGSSAGSDAGGFGGDDSGVGDSSVDDGGGLPALTPCTDPSVSRLKIWEMQVVGGTMVPASGSPLRKVGNAYELYVAFTLQGGGAYGTANAPLNNQGQYTNGADPTKNAVDLSGAKGVTLEYSTTGSTYMQIRTGTVPHGGDHFRADMPVTGDQIKTITLNFADFRRPGGTTPPGTDILKDVFSFTFVAGATTTLTLLQVRAGDFKPPCN